MPSRGCQRLSPAGAPASRGSFEEQLAEAEASGNEKKRAGVDKALTAHRAIGPHSPVPRRFGPAGWSKALPPGADWVVASYLAGVRARRALFGLPLGLLSSGLARVAFERGRGGLPFVVNLPRALHALRAADELGDTECERVLSDFSRNRSPEWAAEPEQHNELLVGLQGLSGAPNLLEIWFATDGFPAWLRDELEGFRTVEPGGLPPARRAMRVLRRIQHELLDDPWGWAGSSEGERLLLNVYMLLTLDGWQPLSGATRGRTRLRRSDALHVVIEALASPCEQGSVYPALVRTLKRLLFEELQSVKRADRVIDTARRQLAMVRQALAVPEKPKTVTKDLATIVYRILERVHEVDPAAVIDLFYGVLHAHPEPKLFREAVAYCVVDEIRDAVTAVIVVEDALDGEDDQAVLDAYDRYAEVMEPLSPDGSVDCLDRLVAVLTRPADPPGPEVTAEVLRGSLRSVVLSGLRAAEHFTTYAEPVASESSNVSRAPSAGDAKPATVPIWQWIPVDDVARGSMTDLEHRLEAGTRDIIEEFRRVLQRVAQLETECLTGDTASRLDQSFLVECRELLLGLEDLESLCARHLPLLERQVCTRLLRNRIAAVHARTSALVAILGRQDEAAAIEVLAACAAPPNRGLLRKVLRAYDRPSTYAATAAVDPADAHVIQEWMLRRYMLRELAAAHGLRVMGWLTSTRVMALWILAPFVACSVLQHVGEGGAAGYPFGLALVGNLAMLAAYAVEVGRAGRRGNRLMSPARFLLPQTAAALFLGISQLIAADESWSMGVTGNRLVALASFPVFLLLGFYFTRDVLLDQQLQSRDETRARSRRAARVMALSVWQSSALVLFFGIMSSRLMAGPGRAEIEIPDTEVVPLSLLLPHEICVDSSFGVVPLCDDAAFRIFPWALLVWMVNVFFFSVIFERIIQRRED